MQQIVIVGGGAGGLGLATQLGRRYGKRKKSEITLIDGNSTHLWKPLLHEVATGALDSGIDELNYSAHGKRHGFRFQQGLMSGLDRSQQRITLAAMHDDDGKLVLPERHVSYDTLVIAIGSVTNNFSVEGADDYCTYLDSREQAERFHRKLLNEFIRASSNEVAPHELNIAIVGGGATGVELSAELYNTADVLSNYNMAKVTSDRLKVTLIEAGERILPALPERISAAATRELEHLGVSVLTKTQVTAVTPTGFTTKNGKSIDATLKVWAAGIKGPEFLSQLGLACNRANQLTINESLQTEDPNIFAIGDCAYLVQANNQAVPPRAQAANQQAKHLLRVIAAQLRNKPLPKFKYQDRGSLVSLSRYTAVGSLMGNLTKGSMMIEGSLARWVYVSLYRMHQITLHGYWHTLLLGLVGRINRVIRPSLKLH